MKLHDFPAHKNCTAGTKWWKTIGILNTLDLWEVGGPAGFIPLPIWASAVTHFCSAARKKKVPIVTEQAEEQLELILLYPCFFG